VKHSGNTGFLRRDGGHVAVIFGLVLSLLAATGGFAIDASRQVTTKRLLQSMTDAAALSGAKEFATSGSQIKTLERIESSLRANVTNRFADARCGSLSWGGEFTEGSIWVRATCVVPTMFGVGISGKSHMFVTTSSRAKASSTTLDLALVVDMSGSMTGSKRTAVKTGAKNLVDSLSTLDERVRIALVSYSSGVNAGIYANAARGLAHDYDPDGDGLEIHCVGERPGAEAFTDAPPGPNAYIGEGTSGTANCRVRQIVPLSKDSAMLKTEIDSLINRGYTAGHIGIAWGWYVLSPNWASFWPSASRPTAYGNPDELKVMVLMTDGRFNREYHETTLGESHEQAETLCANMRSEGIIIFTIAFDVATNLAAQTMMQECATSDDYYFRADDEAALIAAYSDIASRFQGVALVK